MRQTCHASWKKRGGRACPDSQSGPNRVQPFTHIGTESTCEYFFGRVLDNTTPFPTALRSIHMQGSFSILPWSLASVGVFLESVDYGVWECMDLSPYPCPLIPVDVELFCSGSSLPKLAPQPINNPAENFTQGFATIYVAIFNDTLNRSKPLHPF